MYKERFVLPRRRVMSNLEDWVSITTVCFNIVMEMIWSFSFIGLYVCFVVILLGLLVCMILDELERCSSTGLLKCCWIPKSLR